MVGIGNAASAFAAASISAVRSAFEAVSARAPRFGARTKSAFARSRNDSYARTSRSVGQASTGSANSFAI